MVCEQKIIGFPILRVQWLLTLLACVAVSCGPPKAELDPTEHLPGGDTTNLLLMGSNAYIRPAKNLSDEHETMFYSGNSWFNQSWVQAPTIGAATRDGLGPLYNATSCSSCHFKDGRGRGLDHDLTGVSGLLFRLSIPGEGEHGAIVPDPIYGGQLQDFGLPDVPGEGRMAVEWEEVAGTYGDGESYSLRKPTYSVSGLGYGPLDDAILISPRVAPAVIGLGLLEAISVEELLAQADPDDVDGDGISGKPNWVPDLRKGELSVGRFGWKSEQPTVAQQAAGAFAGDVGITTSIFPDLNCAEVQGECREAANGGDPEFEDRLFAKMEVYTQALAVPARREWDTDEVLRGKLLFSEAGCTGCHTPSYETGTHPTLDEMSGQKIWPYTDLLLHDMGEALADNRPSYAADGREWRTAPLWGLGLVETVNKHDNLMHDGRARGFAEAILWHGGEAEEAKEVFLAMPSEDRENLVRFLKSL